MGPCSECVQGMPPDSQQQQLRSEPSAINQIHYRGQLVIILGDMCWTNMISSWTRIPLFLGAAMSTMPCPCQTHSNIQNRGGKFREITVTHTKHKVAVGWPGFSISGFLEKIFLHQTQYYLTIPTSHKRTHAHTNSRVYSCYQRSVYSCVSVHIIHPITSTWPKSELAS